jgi:hypothetical protein
MSGLSIHGGITIPAVTVDYRGLQYSTFGLEWEKEARHDFPQCELAYHLKLGTI